MYSLRNVFQQIKSVWGKYSVHHNEGPSTLPTLSTGEYCKLVSVISEWLTLNVVLQYRVHIQ